MTIIVKFAVKCTIQIHSILTEYTPVRFPINRSQISVLRHFQGVNYCLTTQHRMTLNDLLNLILQYTMQRVMALFDRRDKNTHDMLLVIHCICVSDQILTVH